MRKAFKKSWRGISQARQADRRHDTRRSATLVDSMTGDQSRYLSVGDRVCWNADKNDQGTVTEKNWAGVTVKWDNRSKQSILHNDMAQVERVPVKIV